MVNGLIGKKIGMVQIFGPEGRAIGCTVVEVGPCTVIQKKPMSRVQLGFEQVSEKRVNKPRMGLFERSGTPPFRTLREFTADDPDALDVGQEIKADIFAPGEILKVTGSSKGKGFAGVMKRWNFGGGKESHGSRSHRIPGAVGQCAYPARIFKGKRMPGRMGGERVTVPRVQVVDVRPDQNLVFLRGPIPGANGGIVLLRKN